MLRKKSHSGRHDAALKVVNRRQVLEGLGALAATAACSSGESVAPHGAAGTTSIAGTGGGNVAGGGAGGSTSGAGRPSSAAGTGPAGTGGGTSGQAGAEAQASGGNAGGGTGAQPGDGTGGQNAGGPGGGAPAAGGPAGGTGSGGAAAGSGGTGTAGAGGAGGGLVAPPWDDVPVTAMCTQVSATDAAGQGPFFIHELEKSDDISMIRQDIRGRYNESALPGVEMHLHLRLIDTKSTECPDKPIEGVDVYIWHTDAEGYYSGFGTRGSDDEQKPDTKYAGKPNNMNLENADRFLRGVQTTDANGVVSFRSIFPGWYNGRALHIHFVAFKPGSMSKGRVDYTDSNSGGTWLFTTQFYFDTAFSKSIHEKNDPYKARTTISAYNDALAANENGNSKLHFTASLAGDTDGVGGIVTAQMQLKLDPKT